MANKNFEVKHGLSVGGTERISSAGVGTFTDLNVTGTTTTIDTATLQVQDKNIVLNYGTGDTSSTANGAGITIQDAVDAASDATLLWDNSNSEFDFSHTVTAPSLTIAGAATFDTSTLVVDATNNRVGIGTASPAEALHVTGDIRVDTDLYIQPTNKFYLDGGNDTYLTEVAANTLTFNTAGAEHMRIDSAGTLFLGTNSPTLHSAQTGIVFENGSLLTDTPRAASRSISLAQNAAVDSGNTWAYLSTDEASLFQQFGGNHYFKTAASGSAGADVTFNTKLFIANDGKIGIGNSTPGNSHSNANLLVVGSGSAGGMSLWNGANDGGYYFARDNANNTDAYDGGMSYDGNRNLGFHTNGGLERMTINGTGHVFVDNGIGVSTKTTMANMNHNWQTNVYNTFTAGGVAIGTDSSNTSHMWWNVYDTGSKYAVSSGYGMDQYVVNSDGSYSWRFSDNASGAGSGVVLTEQFRMKRTGDTHIAIDEADAILYLGSQGGAFGGNGSAWMRNASSTLMFNSPSSSMNFELSGTQRGYLNSSGWQNGSDISLKENIEDITYGLDTVKLLRPRKFDRKGAPEEEKAEVGFIAQEVESIIPELISEAGTTPTKGMNYGALTSVLVKAIQELEARVKELEG